MPAPRLLTEPNHCLHSFGESRSVLSPVLSSLHWHAVTAAWLTPSLIGISHTSLCGARILACPSPEWFRQLHHLLVLQRRCVHCPCIRSCLLDMGLWPSFSKLFVFQDSISKPVFICWYQPWLRRAVSPAREGGAGGKWSRADRCGVGAGRVRTGSRLLPHLSKRLQGRLETAEQSWLQTWLSVRKEDS